MRKLPLLIALSLLAVTCDSLKGPAGPEGPAGDDGVANIHTETFSINSANTESDQGIGLNQIDVPEVTPAVVNDGVVKVEIEAIDNGWFGLPWTFSSDYDDNLEVDETIELNYGYDEGHIYIAHISSYSLLLESDIQEGPYKLTVIPPSESNDSDNTNSKIKPLSNIGSIKAKVYGAEKW